MLLDQTGSSNEINILLACTYLIYAANSSSVVQYTKARVGSETLIKIRTLNRHKRNNISIYLSQ